jgi:hypothetical protein
MRTVSLVVLAVLVVVAAGIAGCKEQTRTGDQQQVMGTCAVCGAKAPVGTYCEKCKAVTVAEVKTFKCPSCGKMVKEGTWCEKHNKFRFADAEMTCPKIGKTVTKGAYCPKCSGYHGLPTVKYDAEKKVPVARK